MTPYDFYSTVEPDEKVGSKFISLYNQADSVYTNNKFARPISMRPGIVTEGMGYDQIFDDASKVIQLAIVATDTKATFSVKCEEGNVIYEKYIEVDGQMGQGTVKQIMYSVSGTGKLSVKATNSEDYQFRAWQIQTDSGSPQIVNTNPIVIDITEGMHRIMLIESVVEPTPEVPVDIDTDNVPDTFSVQGEGNYNVGGQASVSINSNTGDPRTDNEGNTFIGWINPNAVSE